MSDQDALKACTDLLAACMRYERTEAQATKYQAKVSNWLDELRAPKAAQRTATEKE